MACPVPRTVGFKWRIDYPFFNDRPMEGNFYSGNWFPEHWKVLLRPLIRGYDTWTFEFSLHRLFTWEPRPRDMDIFDESRANNFRVIIYVSEREISGMTMVVRRQEEFFCFTEGARYVFEASLPNQREFVGLFVEVEMSFLGPDPSTLGLFTQNLHLRRLSEDLGRLLSSGLGSDMTLKAVDSQSNFRVHSYIMYVRWRELFRVHEVNLEDDNPTVETRLSAHLLEEILFYLYTGKYPIIARREFIPCTTELFQAIDRYKLHHLYQVFTTGDSRQYRFTRIWTHVNTNNFRLHRMTTGLPLNPREYTWDIRPGTESELLFQVECFLYDEVPSFTYSMLSRSRFILHARVHVRYLIRGKGIFWSRKVHERDYLILPEVLERSGSCEFEGPQPDLADFIAGSFGRDRAGKVYQHFLQCTVYINQGWYVSTVYCEGDPTERMSRPDRFNVLSGHMSLLYMNYFTELKKVDLQIETNYLSERGPMIVSHWHYRALLETRFPGWRSGVVERENDWPECPYLPTKALERLDEYVYMGKMYRMQSRYLDQVDDFARRTGFEAFRRISRASNRAMEASSDSEDD